MYVYLSDKNMMYYAKSFSIHRSFASSSKRQMSLLTAFELLTQNQ